MDGQVARHLDRDDMVANTIQTFNSLTVQCAQCHNHKFDPILQEDYYSLQAVFAAVDRLSRQGTLTVSRARCFGYTVSIGPAPPTPQSLQDRQGRALFCRLG